MARHRSDGAWDQRADAELIRAVRHWHETNPVPDLPEEYRGQASAVAEQAAAEPRVGPRPPDGDGLVSRPALEPLGPSERFVARHVLDAE